MESRKTLFWPNPRNILQKWAKMEWNWMNTKVNITFLSQRNLPSSNSFIYFFFRHHYHYSLSRENETKKVTGEGLGNVCEGEKTIRRRAFEPGQFLPVSVGSVLWIFFLQEKGQLFHVGGIHKGIWHWAENGLKYCLKIQITRNNSP